ncbi:Peroxidasin-like protein [Frankliniella fusca]|uniref:Peroxidasin-like protein n=1 Tax=Frankliniella fusca TaxID=407009 RepID=A0AAE1HMR7_9NEOP|nr:Peroxidasin-like protein [Frankliniella fusca]
MRWQPKQRCAAHQWVLGKTVRYVLEEQINTVSLRSFHRFLKEAHGQLDSATAPKRSGTYLNNGLEREEEYLFSFEFNGLGREEEYLFSFELYDALNSLPPRLHLLGPKNVTGKRKFFCAARSSSRPQRSWERRRIPVFLRVV